MNEEKELLACWAATSIVAMAPAGAALLPSGVSQTAQLGGVTEYRLANGEEIVLYPMPSRPDTVVRLVYGIGSRDDVPGTTGYAHLLEHMLFKGTPTLHDVQGAYRSLGIAANAFTSFDSTDYVSAFAAKTSTLEWVIDFEAQRMTQASFTEQDLRTEMSVVRNEWEIEQSHAEAPLAAAVRAAAFPFHPYGRPPIGQRDDIENVDFRQLRSLYAARYRPDNAVLVISGAIDVTQALSRAAQAFGRLPPPEQPLALPRLIEPPQRGERDVHLYRAGAQPSLQLAYHAPAGRQADSYALLVLGEILTGDGNGLLDRDLAKSGHAAGATVRLDLLRDPGLLWITATQREWQGLPGLHDALTTLLEGTLADRIDAAALKAAQQRIAFAAAQAAGEAALAGQQLAAAVAQGDWRLAFALRDGCAAVTLADVQRVARTYLNRLNRTSGFQHPLLTPAVTAMPAPQPLDQQLATLMAAPSADASAGTPSVAGEAIDFNPTTFDFDTRRLQPRPGLRLAVMRKRLAGDQARLHLGVRFGTPAQGARGGAAWRLMPAMLMAGSTTRDRASLQAELSRLGMSFSVTAEPQGLDIALSGPAGRIEAALALFADLLQHARMAPADLPDAKAHVLKEISATRDAPATHIGATYARLWNDARHIGPADPGYRWAGEELAAAIQATTLDELQRQQHELWGGSDLRIAALGDIDAARLAATAERAFADWQPGAPYVPPAADFVAMAGQRHHAISAGTGTAALDATIYLPMRPDHEDYWPLALASQMLAGGPDSRLWTRLRQQLGASYDVSSHFSAALRGDIAFFDIQATFSPPQADAVLSAIGEEIDRTREHGFDQREVERARNRLIISCPGMPSMEAWLVCMLDRQNDDGRTFADWRKAAMRVYGTSERQATQALRKYIAWPAFVVVTAGPTP